MKQKTIGLLLLLIGCSLFASPRRKGSPCPYAEKENAFTVTKPAIQTSTGIAEELDYLPIGRIVNSLL